MITMREKDVYEFILKYQKSNGYSPLLREIADSIGIKSKGVAHRYIKSLEKHGMIDGCFASRLEIKTKIVALTKVLLKKAEAQANNESNVTVDQSLQSVS